MDIGGPFCGVVWPIGTEGKENCIFPFLFLEMPLAKFLHGMHAFRRTIIRGMGARAKKEKENKRNGDGSGSEIALGDELFKLGQEFQNSDP